MRAILLPEDLSEELKIFIMMYEYSILHDCPSCDRIQQSETDFLVAPCHYHKYVRKLMNQQIKDEVKNFFTTKSRWTGKI